jgi:hypothetical protein
MAVRRVPRPFQQPDDVSTKAHQPGDDQDGRDNHEITPPHQRDKQTPNTSLEQEGTEINRRGRRRLRWQRHGKESIADAYDHHANPSDRREMRVPKHIRQDISGQELVDLVETQKDTHRHRRKHIRAREIDMHLDAAGNLRAAHAERQARRDVRYTGGRRRCRPRHPAELGNPEVRDHADQSDEDHREGHVVASACRKRHAEHHRHDDIHVAQNGHRKPSDRNQMDKCNHSRVIEEAGDRVRIRRGEGKGERQRDMRRHHVQGDQTARRNH